MEVARPALGKRGFRISIPWEGVAGIATAGAVVFLIGAPLAMLLFSSVRSTRDRLPFEVTSFTLDNYLQVFSSENTYRLFANTLSYAAGATLLGLALAMVFAYLIERTNIPLRTLVLVVVLAPMSLPPFVAGMAWVLLANPRNGIINVLLRGVLQISGDGPLNIYSIPGMILVGGIMFVPSMYIMISGTFSRMDPALEEASLLSGVSPRATLRRITAPLLRPGILGAAIYYFVVSIEIFEIPALLGMPGGIYTLSTWIYYLVHPPGRLPDYGLASSFGILTLAIAGALIYLYGRTTRQRERFITVTGRGYRPRLIDLRRWRFPLLAGAVVYSFFTVALPFVILAWKSLVPAYSDFNLASLTSVSLNVYLSVLTNFKVLDAARNTAVIALVTSTGTMALAMLVAWLAIRSGFRAGALPDRLAFVAHGVPAIVVGLAVMFVYISLPLPIYGTVWIITIALATRYIAYGSRVMSAAYLQIHRELEEASWTSGVPWGRTMRRIVLPLVWPAYSRGWLWMFVHALRDVTIVLMLVSVGNETIGARLWFIWFESANQSHASALSVMLMLASAMLTYFVARQTLLRREDVGRL